MLRGLYTAASGMLADTIRTDIISNNLANVNTTGYKKDVVVQQEFPKLLLQRIHDGADSASPLNTVGQLGTGTTVTDIVTNHQSGQLRQTGNPLDMALVGAGFFTVQTPQGIRYTRNGSFTRNAKGELVTGEGYQVLGRKGPIRIGNQVVTVGETGDITADGVPLDTLRIANFTNLSQLQKEGNSLYATNGNVQATPAANTRVVQQTLEGSNVNTISEMVNMIAVYRSYEANQKVIVSQDELLGKAVNDVGKL